MVAHLSLREADTSKQSQGNKEERFKECIKVIHPIMPSDRREKEIQKEGRREGGRCTVYQLHLLS